MGGRGQGRLWVWGCTAMMLPRGGSHSPPPEQQCPLGCRTSREGKSPEHIPLKADHVTPPNTLSHLKPLPSGSALTEKFILHGITHSALWDLTLRLSSGHQVPACLATLLTQFLHLQPQEVWETVPALRELIIWVEKQRFWVCVQHMKISKPFCFLRHSNNMFLTYPFKWFKIGPMHYKTTLLLKHFVSIVIYNTLKVTKT